MSQNFTNITKLRKGLIWDVPEISAPGSRVWISHLVLTVCKQFSAPARKPCTSARLAKPYLMTRTAVILRRCLNKCLVEADYKGAKLISTTQNVILSLQVAQNFDGHQSYISNEINLPTNAEVTNLWYILTTKKKSPALHTSTCLEIISFPLPRIVIGSRSANSWVMCAPGFLRIYQSHYFDRQFYKGKCLCTKWGVRVPLQTMPFRIAIRTVDFKYSVHVHVCKIANCKHKHVLTCRWAHHHQTIPLAMGK